MACLDVWIERIVERECGLLDRPIAWMEAVLLLLVVRESVRLKSLLCPSSECFEKISGSV